MKPNHKNLILWSFLIACVILVSGLVQWRIFSRSGRWGKSDSQDSPPATGCGGVESNVKAPKAYGVQNVKVDPKGKKDTDDKKEATPSPTIWDRLPSGVRGPFLMLKDDQMLAQRKIDNLDRVVMMERKAGQWKVTKEARLYGEIFDILGTAGQDRPLMLLSYHQGTTTLWSMELESFQPRSIRTFSQHSPRVLAPYTETQAFVASDNNVWVYHHYSIFEAPIEPAIKGMLRLFCNVKQECFALTANGRLLQLQPQWSLSSLNSSKSRILVPKLVKEIVPPNVAAKMPSAASGKLRHFASLADSANGAVVYMNQVVWGCRWDKLNNHKLPDDAGNVSGLFWYNNRLWLGFERKDSSAYLASINLEGELEMDSSIPLPIRTSRIERHGPYLFATQGERVLFHSMSQGTYRKQFERRGVCE